MGSIPQASEGPLYLVVLFVVPIQQYQAWLGEVAGSASEEEGGSSVVRSKPTLQNRPSLAFDYIEAANSASSVSTPTNEPFASDDLGETVIKLDKMKLVGNGGGLSTASPLKTDASESLPDAMVQCGSAWDGVLCVDASMVCLCVCF